MAKSRSEVNSYYHGTVDMGSGNSADYVVAHGERQKHRGKRAAVSYRDIRNPQVALEAARQDIEARTSSAFIGREIPHYRAEYSGRVAVMHAEDNEFQKECAAMFVDARIEDGRCIGGVILGDLKEIDYKMPSVQINADGTSEVPYIYG